MKEEVDYQLWRRWTVKINVSRGGVWKINGGNA